MRLATRYFKLFLAACMALAAAGCTGSNLLPTGNSQVEFEFEVVGTENTVGDFDCVNLRFSQMAIRPLDGICAAPSSNAGDACLGPADCAGGPCEGGSANGVIQDSIDIVTGNGTSFGNLLGSACELPDLALNCAVAGTPCTSDDDCDLTNPFNTCAAPFTNFAAEAFLPPLPATTSEGLYEISSLIFQFGMFEGSPPTGLLCEGNFEFASEFGDDLRFLVSTGSTKRVRFRLDVARLEEWLETTCSPGASDLIPEIFECLDCDGAP